MEIFFWLCNLKDFENADAPHLTPSPAPSKNQQFINAEIADGAVFKARVFQSTLGFSDASEFSAHSVVKLEDMVISQKIRQCPPSPCNLRQLIGGY